MLDIKDIKFNRAEDGNLLPQIIRLESLEDKPEVKVVPLTRGKLQEIYNKAVSDDINVKLEADEDIIRFGLVEPKLSDGDIKDLKPKFATAITTAILAISLDINQDDISKQTNQAILNREFELKKK